MHLYSVISDCVKWKEMAQHGRLTQEWIVELLGEEAKLVASPKPVGVNDLKLIVTNCGALAARTFEKIRLQKLVDVSWQNAEVLAIYSTLFVYQSEGLRRNFMEPLTKHADMNARNKQLQKSNNNLREAIEEMNRGNLST